MLLLALAALTSALEIQPLALGQSLEVAFGVLDDEPVFRVVVPKRATALRVSTSGANYDVDIYGSLGVAPEPYEGVWDVVSEGTWIDETLLITITDSMPLVAGEWFFVVVLSDSEPMEDEGARLTLSLEAQLVAPTEHELIPGEPLDLVLNASNGVRAELRPKLDESQYGRGWRVEVYSPLTDVNLLIGPAQRRFTHTAPLAKANTALSWESLELESDWLERGARLQVYGSAETPPFVDMPVRVLLSPIEDAPGLVPELVLPPLTGTVGVAPAFARAVGATVSIVGPLGAGSGVVVSASGLVLTNAHVVVGATRGERRRELACGFTTDARSAPIPAFRLSVLDSREDLDLALLQITGALNGRAAPASMSFPSIELAPPDALQLGQTVFGVGFPMTGGSRSYVSVSLTRGIISGFAQEHEGLVLKTDAAIHAGVSGGACVDEQGRLLGVPAYTISDSNGTGGLGFVLPIALLPAAWRERIWPTSDEPQAHTTRSDRAEGDAEEGDPEERDPEERAESQRRSERN